MLNFEFDAPKLIIGDKNKIFQIVQNLVDNAIKFTNQGYIKLDVRAEKLDKNKARFFITVSDTGIGIDSSKQEIIFQPYIQVASGINNKDSGIGLGLSIVNKLAKEINGIIKLESIVNQGSSFSLITELGVK